MLELMPKARTDLNFSQIRQNGQTFYVVQDPFGVFNEPLCISEFAVVLLSLLDGARSLGEIQALFDQSAPDKLSPDFVQTHVAEIERIGLLQTEAYFNRKQEIVDGFVRSDLRPASHANAAYQGGPEELSDWIESILAETDPSAAPKQEPPRVVVAPHIDFRVNTEVYSHAYRALRGCRYDRVVLMGTGHSIMEGVYCPTLKRYSTPLGETATDREAVEKLTLIGDGVVSPNDFPHRSEHALEFQMIFLQHLLGADAFELVPVLCGSVCHLMEGTSRLRDADGFPPFLDALRGIIEERGRKTLVVAGVDLSHIGLRFSHPAPASEMLDDARRHDRGLIDAFIRWDPEAFWEAELRSGGRFNVCGFSTLSTILETVQPGAGRCLAYDVWDDSPTGSAVTFAALVA
jgi:hypothetical protein